uniref:Ctd-like (NLI interacting factor-like) phosphatase n=1 Tax=Pithovirus LCDPAC01 TaxID=2506600 RepID=A0A481YNK9_9VIRU|nr:MAG: ctd-like (NLI interacting factor-like) phosphatase [Pithovirus LCDPAC01]
MKSNSTIVLDLDETLVHSFSSPEFIKRYEIYGNNYEKFHPPGEESLCYSLYTDDIIWGTFRPHLKTFINEVSDIFDNVIIWSAGTKDYVSEIVRLIYDGETKIPKLIQSRQHCQLSRGYYLKTRDLETYIHKNKLDMDFDINRTVILDDKNYTFLRNRKNGILIPPYSPGEYSDSPSIDKLLDRKDTALLDFVNWCKRVKIKDVTCFTSIDKNNIFNV